MFKRRTPVRSPHNVPFSEKNLTFTNVFTQSKNKNSRKTPMRSKKSKSNICESDFKEMELEFKKKYKILIANDEHFILQVIQNVFQ